MPATPKLSITRSISQGDLNPVGMIVQSVLTEVQFQALNGTSWVLMDGRSVTGSTYATVTGSSTIPDARGMVLRGKNNGRSDGKENPGTNGSNGELNLGAYQEHSFSSHDHGGGGHTHNHRSLTPNLTAGSAGGGGGPGYSTDGGVLTAAVYVTNGANSTVVAPEGGFETRMRNITVNHFIKIN